MNRWMDGRMDGLHSSQTQTTLVLTVEDFYYTSSELSKGHTIVYFVCSFFIVNGPVLQNKHNKQ